MKILNHTIELSLRARWPWSHFRVHKYEYYTHVVWGKLSFEFGQSHLMPVTLCKECDSDAVGGVSYGDEGWTVCDDCGAVEQGTYEVTLEEFEKMY